VKNAIETDDDDEDEEFRIIIPKVKGSVLKYVADFCTHYTTQDKMHPIQTPIKSVKIEDQVQGWYVEFISRAYKNDLLFELVRAANFMNIAPLLQLACFKVAITIKGLKREEILHTFQLSSVLTEEEEQHIKEENQWTR
jgi:hypothetical protein